MAEEVVHHVHAAAFSMLEHDDGDAGRRHPGYQALEVREPLVGGDVIEGVEQSTRSPCRRRALPRDGSPMVSLRRHGLSELAQQIGVGFDGDGAAEAPAKALVTSPLPAPASMKTFRAGKPSTTRCNQRLAFRFWSV